MPDEKTEEVPLSEGYQPTAEDMKKGYQPKIDANKARPEGGNPPSGGSNVQSPTTSKQKD